MTQQKYNTDFSHFQCVGEFHKIFDHPIKTKKYKNFYKDPELFFFRLDLIKEEINELQIALNNKDIVDIADALCDIIYVIYGMSHTLGINMDDLIKKKSSNMYDFTFSIKKIKINNEFIENICKDLKSYINSIIYYFIYKNLENIGNNLFYILQYIYNLGYSFNLNINNLFLEVHRSNMSKICLTKNDAIDTINIYIKEKRYKTPSYKIKNNYYIIYDIDTTKILKNHKWNKPQLHNFIEDLYIII